MKNLIRKIRKSDLEILKLTSQEVLLTLFDLSTPFFQASSLYRQSIRKYLAQRAIDRQNFLIKVKYLRQKGYIETFIQSKERYAELTSKGKKYSKFLLLKKIEISQPKKWDKKWRVVIFDIPEKIHRTRDVFREHLKKLQFVQIQKSVYVYPFECVKEISLLTDNLNIAQYVTIMITEIIQGEEKIIRKFLETEILSPKMLK